MMRQMRSSEQAQVPPQDLHHYEDEHDHDGYDHWVAEDEDDGEEYLDDEEDYKLTPKHKIRTPIMEETESTVEMVGDFIS